MASEEDLSPEEKLLKVIQQAKPGESPVPRQSNTPNLAQRTTVGTTSEPVVRPESSPRLEPSSKIETEPGTMAPVGTGTNARTTTAPVVAASGVLAANEHPVVRPDASRFAPGASQDKSQKASAAAAPAAAEIAAAKKLTLQPKTPVGKGGQKTAGKMPAATQTEASRPVARTRKTAAGSTLRIFNRVLAAAAAMLLVAVVLELMAAKPFLPDRPDNSGSPVVFSGTNVPAPQWQACEDALKRDVWRFSGPTNLVPGVPPASILDQINKYMADNVKLEGVSPAQTANQSFAVITEKGSIRYLRMGDELSVSVSTGNEKVKLESVRKNEAGFLFQGQPIILKGVK